MEKPCIILTTLERADYLKLRNQHSCGSIPCRVAVETLIDGMESANARSSAHAMIERLANKGAVTYNRYMEMVSIQDVAIPVAATGPAVPPRTPDPSRPTLLMFVNKLSLARTRAISAMFAIHDAQGGDDLPPHLAEVIIGRLRDQYPNGQDVPKSADQIRQIIAALWECGVLEHTQARGIYRFTEAGLAIRKLVRHRIIKLTPSQPPSAPPAPNPATVEKPPT